MKTASSRPVSRGMGYPSPLQQEKRKQFNPKEFSRQLLFKIFTNIISNSFPTLLILPFYIFLSGGGVSPKQHFDPVPKNISPSPYYRALPFFIIWIKKQYKKNFKAQSKLVGVFVVETLQKNMYYLYIFSLHGSKRRVMRRANRNEYNFPEIQNEKWLLEWTFVIL